MVTAAYAMFAFHRAIPELDLYMNCCSPLPEVSDNGLCRESVASRAEMVYASLAKNCSACDAMN